MRLKIGYKLLFIGGFSGFLLVASVLYGNWQAWQIIHQLHHSLDAADDSSAHIWALKLQYAEEIHAWKNVLVRSNDDQSHKFHMELFDTAFAKVDALAQEELQHEQDARLRDSIDKFRIGHQENRARYQRAIEILKNTRYKDDDAADAVVIGIDKPVMKYLTDANVRTNEIADKIGEDATRDAETEVLESLGYLLVSAIVGGVLFLNISRRYLERPTINVLNALDKIKDGDFTLRPQPSYQDEIGDITNSTRQLSERLGHLIAQVKLGAHRLADTAQRVEFVSKMTSEGVKSQQGETDHASQAMEQMANSMRLSVVSANEAVVTSGEVVDMADKVAAVLGDAVKTVQDLASEVNNTADAISSLKNETQDIGAVVLTIRSVADQTNLLALNAAIEAARAGEQGRGFAVVADEVRKLAVSAQEATDDISARIEKLQNSASEAMGVMLEGRERAERGVDQVSKSSVVLNRITSAALSIRQINDHIATILQDQQGVGQSINATILNISHVADQTAHSSLKTSEEITKVADEARFLNELVAGFVVPESDSQHRAPTPVEATASKEVELF